MDSRQADAGVQLMRYGWLVLLPALLLTRAFAPPFFGDGPLIWILAYAAWSSWSASVRIGRSAVARLSASLMPAMMLAAIELYVRTDFGVRNDKNGWACVGGLAALPFIGLYFELRRARRRKTRQAKVESNA